MIAASGTTTYLRVVTCALALGTALSAVTALPGLGQEREMELRLQGMGGMGWTMGLISLLLLVFLILGIAALIKYLMSGSK